jgi:hypothetical protein
MSNMSRLKEVSSAWTSTRHLRRLEFYRKMKDEVMIAAIFGHFAVELDR